MLSMLSNVKIAVVIPCYKVESKILAVIKKIGSECCRIYVVDDACPNQSGEMVQRTCTDDRIIVLKNPKNLGVGGAVMRGYQAALDEGMDILVKLDGDGQMDPSLIPDLIYPILSGAADYTKGNRFYNLEKIYCMPKLRLLGNATLSFITKFSTGYWDIFDPTNGYTAISAHTTKLLPFKKISHRYFFETDMLFRLNTIRAVVMDVPIDAFYADEVSNLKISKVLREFLWKHIRNFFKRILYNYYLRDMSVGSFELPMGLLLMLFGITFGGYHWYRACYTGIQTPLGTIMLSALCIILGLQFLLAFIAGDINLIPKKARTLPFSMELQSNSENRKVNTCSLLS